MMTSNMNFDAWKKWYVAKFKLTRASSMLTLLTGLPKMHPCMTSVQFISFSVVLGDVLVTGVAWAVHFPC